MRNPRLPIVIAIVFILGITVGSWAAKKRRVGPAAWSGVSPTEAAANLLDHAVELAETGSWENIHLGRTYYLSGDKARGEAIFARYQQGKAEPSDLIRIGRVYAQAGDWEKAKAVFDRVVSMDPKDADWLVEVGAYYNLNGDRAHAEGLFARGFDTAPRHLDNTLDAAGSYLGLPPRKR